MKIKHFSPIITFMVAQKKYMNFNLQTLFKSFVGNKYIHKQYRLLLKHKHALHFMLKLKTKTLICPILHNLIVINTYASLVVLLLTLKCIQIEFCLHTFY